MVTSTELERNSYVVQMVWEWLYGVEVELALSSLQFVYVEAWYS